ncbi:MAG TPA: biosynthetic peptidoglycan transglycosylase, partial [Hyphomicrobiaceae bacterium]
MLDWFFRSNGRKRVIDWLGLDARIDSGLVSAWEKAKDRYDAFSTFFARFRLTGWKRGVNELISEALTLGVGGLALLYVMAIPALTEFDESRFTAGKFAVTFVDRNGTEIGRRGILHNDAVSLEEIPDHLIKATLATEDRRFYDHFGIDILGTLRALMENARANEVVQGGSSITQQLAKNLFLSNERSLSRKIK